MKKILPLWLLAIGLSLNVSAQTWLWGEQGNSALKADLAGNGIATNKTGNVYAVGGYEDNISFGSYTLTSAATQDMFLVKYAPNGNVLWANTSVNNEYGRVLGTSVATDDSDNAYVTGFDFNFFEGTDTATFGSYTLDLPGFGYLFLVKYNANGTVAWAKQPNTGVLPVGTQGQAVATDKFGHEYVTGGSAPFLIKYDRNGNVIWTAKQKVGNSGFDYALGYSLSTDASGNIYMTGYFTDSLYIGANKFYSANQGVFIAKYDSSGNVLWAKQSTNNHFTNYMPATPVVTTDYSGAAYLTASFSYAITFGTYSFSAADSDNFVIVKYNPGGSMAWAKQSFTNDSVGWDSYSISTDDSNRVYVTGGEFPYGTPITNCSLLFNNATISFADSFKNDMPAFLLKLDTAGKVLCNSIILSGGAQPTAVTADSTGTYVYLAGRYDETVALGNDTLTSHSGGHGAYLGRWQSCIICNSAAAVSPTSAVVCAGHDVVLTASGGSTYNWSPSAGLSATTGDTVVTTPTITTTYTVTINPLSKCVTTDSVVVTLRPAPNVPTITVSVTGDSLTSSAGSYNQWFFNNQLLTDSTRQVLVIKGHPHGWYYVVVTNPANGCTTTSDSTTGINQLSATTNQLTLYPNPTTGLVTINSTQKINNITVTNLLGQIILAQPNPLSTMGGLVSDKIGGPGVRQIDLSPYPNGMYFVTVTTDAGLVTDKISINR